MLKPYLLVTKPRQACWADISDGPARRASRTAAYRGSLPIGSIACELHVIAVDQSFKTAFIRRAEATSTVGS
jgi:hypothetical protein